MTGVACDLAIIGGGLSGGLIALAARRAQPDRRILLIEAAPTLGGTHLWSFIDSDVGAKLGEFRGGDLDKSRHDFKMQVRQMQDRKAVQGGGQTGAAQLYLADREPHRP